MKKISGLAILFAFFALIGVNQSTAGDLTVTGKVGIGTANPGVKLSVFAPFGSPATSGTTQNGVMRISNSSNTTLDFGGLGSGSYALWIQGTDFTNLATNYPITLQPNGGNVGIGTLSPAADSILHIEQGSPGPRIRLTNTSASGKAWKIHSANNGFLQFLGDDNSTYMTIKYDGNVGIGTSSPTEKLYVAGNIYATGAITQGSSRDLKEDISGLSIKEAIDTVLALEPVKFKYKADTRDQHIGFVAEDVPDAVATPDRKSLSTMDIVAVLTKVVQEQAKAVRKQDEMISALSEKVKALEKMLN
jgi:hypothetical protein